MTLARARSARSRVDRLLLACGLIAGPLFVAVFLSEGWTRDGYDVFRHPVSSLALGPTGWTQTVNFLLCGALTIAFAVAVWRAAAGRVGAVLIAVWGIALVGAGLFVTDPVSGYPIGTPAVLAEYTTSGALHDGFSLPGFLALAAAQVVLARGGSRRWLIYSLLSATAFVVCFLLASSGFAQTEPFVDVAGLFQRLAVITGFAWTVALAYRLVSRP